jgi:autotransporter-associated beta strand protein
VNNNDLTGITVSSITFDAAAGAFVLDGNAVTLSGAIGFNGSPAAPITQTINLDMTWSANETIDIPADGNLTLGGAITSTTDLNKLDPGTLTLGGTNTIESLDVNGGTNTITGNTTLNGNNSSGNYDRFYVGDGDSYSAPNGTLVIQPGATLTVTGDFDDAFVIGRDGGSGTVIQNGGTFTFSPGNQGLFIVGATSEAGTSAAYQMNGGLLDLTGDILAVALGNGVSTTCMVNQVNGVISNVDNLQLGALTPNGHGIYSLSGGSIYIGGGGITTFSGIYAINLGGGTVEASASWSSSLNMNLTGSNGPVTFNPAGNTITLSGALSGSGGLTVTGTGILDLSGVNSYSGDTSVGAGSALELDVTGSGVGAFRLANGSLLNLTFSGSYLVGACYTNNVALPVGTYNAGNLPGFIIGSGSLQVASSISTGIWTGGGGNNNWSTAGNWNQDAVPIFPIGVTFAGTAGLINTNDLTGITLSSITFDAAAGAFVLDGNAVTLSGNIGFNGSPAAPITQTINLDMTWSVNETIDTPTDGNLTLGGAITSTTDLNKLDPGTLTLGGTNTIESLDVNGGTNTITGNTTLNGNNSSGNYDRFYVGDGDSYAAANGTLIIQPGAVLTVTGSFNDAAVIGRDGGSGTVIQNGGTFTFNPANESYLFVGATSQFGTTAAYYMNGGLLDMNGNILGVSLGNVPTTGVVNQIGGVITNVGNLQLGSVTPSGDGIYILSGGSIYIGSGGITTFSGKYTINLGGGTVEASASWSSPLNMNLTGSNGPVTFNPAGNTITLSGALSGSGGLIVAGSGILDLSGANSYSGDTSVGAGSTLELDVTGSALGAFRLANGSLLNLTFSGSYLVGACYTNNVALPVGTYNAGNLPGFITGSGSLQVASSISTGIWTGGGGNNNWSTAGNWNQDAVPIFPIGVTFAGTAGLINTNDLTGITLSSITFDAAAGAFVLDGNAVTLSGNIGFNGNPAAPITQTVNLDMVGSASVSIDVPNNGNLSLAGDITSTTDTSLIKVDTGGLTLGGTDAITSFDFDGGTTTITGNTTNNGDGNSRTYVGDGDYLADCNGTLVIQPGAALTIIGNYADAFVIGRDSGSGTLIQNGGTFTFNPNANPGYIFVGATDNSATGAAYDMNDGVLDMNGHTLSIALAVSGAVTTGLINQAGGVITNVGNFWISPIQAGGLGIYTMSGGSIYIEGGGITTATGNYAINLGGGTVGAEASWSSSLNMNLTGLNGPVTFNPAGNIITLSGVLSGGGGLTVTGAGTLDLTSASSYMGSTTVNGATLELDSAGSGSGAFHLANGALLNLNYSGTYTVAACSTNGVALPAGVYTASNLPGFITGSGSLTIVPAAPPVINPPGVLGGNLIVTGSGGSPGGGYTLLTSTNLVVPMADWTTNAMGTFSGSGTFSNAIPISYSHAAQFFQLRTP